MKISFIYPTEKKLKTWLQNQEKEALNYPFPELTRHDSTFPGYDHDKNKCYLGHGEEVYKKACQALLKWKMFPSHWTKVYAPFEGFREEKEVAVLFRMFGLWWHNSCRILYTLKEENRFGFAYGTLKNHVEKGEEIFYIEMDNEGSVYYKIEAFSRPNKWFTKIGYPVARVWQKKFVRDSFLSMKKEVQTK